MTAAKAEYLLHLVEEKGPGPDATGLVKKLRRVWTQREAHNEQYPFILLGVRVVSD